MIDVTLRVMAFRLVSNRQFTRYVVAKSSLPWFRINKLRGILWISRPYLTAGFVPFHTEPSALVIHTEPSALVTQHGKFSMSMSKEISYLASEKADSTLLGQKII